MLHYGLVLLFATSALAAPSATTVDAIPYSQYQPGPGNGRPINSRVLDLFFSIYDGGDMTTYSTAAFNVAKDIANLGDRNSQAIAAAQTLAILGEVIPGNDGDSCEAAALANAAVTGNRALIRSALIPYIARLNSNIDLIVQLNAGNENVKYATGRKGNCAYGGRVYNYDGVWASLFNRVSPYQLELINEQFCNARRLYNGLTATSNNVGSSLTAASTEPVITIFEQIMPQATGFIQTVANGGNALSAARAMQTALSNAAARY